MHGKRSFLLFSLILVGFLILYGLLIRPHIAGFLYDDGAYLLAAKGLATGLGYVQMAEPGNPAMVKYPPLFSLLLAGVWRMTPNFPQNLIWLKVIPVMFSLGFLGLWAVYCRKFLHIGGGLTAGLLLLVGLDPSMVLASVSLLSEPLYMLLSLWLIVFLKHQEQKNAILERPRDWALLLILSAMAFYARTVGATLILAVVLWLWGRKRPKAALGYGALMLLICLPWLLWTASHPGSHFTSGTFEVLSYNQTYGTEWAWTLRGLGGLWPMLKVGFVAFAQAFSRQFLEGLDAGTAPGWGWSGLILLVAFGGGLVRNIRTRSLSLEGIYVALYLALIATWSAHDQFLRLLLPVLPWLWLWGLRSLMTVSLSWRIGLVAGVVVLALLADVRWVTRWWQDFHGDRMGQGVPEALWGDYEAAFSAVRKNTRPPDLLWSQRQMVYPLYTERKTLAYNFVPLNPRAVLTPAALTADRMAVIQGSGVRYIILESRFQNANTAFPAEPAMASWILNHPEDYRPVYVSPHQWIRIYEILSASSK